MPTLVLPRPALPGPGHYTAKRIRDAEIVELPELRGVYTKIAGIAVSIGARVASLAAPGEVLVSSTVKDLVAGSGLRFEDRGEHLSRASLKRGASSRSFGKPQGCSSARRTEDVDGVDGRVTMNRTA